MTFVINGEFDGRSVRDWLYQNGVSRTLISRLKRLDDGIMVNSSRVTVRYILRAGDRLALALGDRLDDMNENLLPSDLELDIICETEDFIALNKPAGLPTHPSQGHFRDTLANGLAAYYARQGIPFIFRAVNRLDRETSGVVLCAKHQYAASLLSEELRAGRIKKTYLALLNGSPKPPAGRIDLYMRRREASVILREVCTPDADGAKQAVTDYVTLVSGCNGSIVRAEPLTGRTHQLRVSFAHLGTPIVGDGLYGSAESSPTRFDNLASRHMLHALSLEFSFGDRRYTIRAGLPDDMTELCSSISGDDSELRFGRENSVFLQELT